ncbi:telomerase reverse transcriptase [Rhipicephalus sanguineus]|nr:telomerase reverse transcriptase [Rhipicephalus sanguineus]
MLRDLTDLFVVVPRSFPLKASEDLSKLATGACYDNFRSVLTSLIGRECRSDVFSISWYRHGCFGSMLFERTAFRELYDVLGPHCAAMLLLHYYIFERTDWDTYVQWIGPPASGVKLAALPSSKRSEADSLAARSAPRTATPGACNVGHRATTDSRSDCATSVTSASSFAEHQAGGNESGAGRKRPAGVSFSRVRALKAKKPRLRDRKKAGARGGRARQDEAYRFHAWTMLYVSDCRRVERRFMLGCPANLDNAKKLADKVFAPWPDCPEEVRSHPCLVRALRQLLKNHKSCRYGRLLAECCPSQVGSEGSDDSCEDDIDVDDEELLLLSSLSDLVKDHVPARSVSGFLHAALRKLIPVELFGSKTNWRRVVDRAASVARMNKGEVLNTAAFAAELRADHVPWLQRMACVKGNKRLPWLRAVITWCTRLAAAVVSVFFYVTDSRKGKRQLLFYRRRVWNAIVEVWASGEDILEYADASSGPPRMKGVGRLLPKEEARGLRLLVTAPVAKNLEVRFRTLKVFLDSLKGSGGGADDIYRRWKAFVADWKSRGKPKLFFVKADIENCFHSVDHEVMLRVVGRAFERTERDARIVACTVVKLNAYGRVIKHWRQLFAKDVANMAHAPESSSPARPRVSSKAKILVAKTCLLPNSKELKQLLRDYLTKFHFRLHGKTYSLRKGVLQGGHLSADLADVYITAMQRQHLRDFGNSSGELLIRATDDFLYVTSDEERARRFRDTFSQGFSDFGLFANTSKVQTNLVDDEDGGYACMPTPFRDRADFCGYVFDVSTMEVFRDPVSSVPVESVVDKPERRPGEALKKYLQPWHLPVCPLALDPLINSRECVLAGVLDLFVALAHRFFWSVNSMRYVDEGYVTEVVLGILDSFLVRALRWSSGEGVEISLSDEELRYLFLLVFARKADRKASGVGKHLHEVVQRVGQKLALIGDLEHLNECVDLALS